MRFEKWQRNGILEAIKAAGLDPKEFDWDDSDARALIKHKWSESCFVVDHAKDYVGHRVVGDSQDWPFEVHTWQALTSRVSTWASQVKSDLETPDLWAELQREVTLLGARSVELIENTPFTPDEQNEIARRLQRLAGHARNTYSLSPEQIRLLDEKLNYLVEASARLGRIDWLNAFVGAILGYILTAAFPPVSAGHVFDTFIRAIIDLYPLLPSG